jgi:hypothetical protein
MWVLLDYELTYQRDFGTDYDKVRMSELEACR